MNAIAVLDVGKTHAKLSLFGEDGAQLGRTERANAPASLNGVSQLDLAGLAGWLKGALSDAARRAEIDAIIPVAHGAAAVLLDGDEPLAALDYEAEPPAAVATAYEAERDPFEATLSPRLAGGLNLGAQLYWLERLHPDVWPRRGRALLWPQFWAWFLCGESASELTSLGCHSDLWRPPESRWSDLALRRGWAQRLGPLRPAGAVLGEVRPALGRELGLSPSLRVHCGLHDSNAALAAARSYPELGARFSVLSTGTWFVAMRTGAGAPVCYDPARDVLANVDVSGSATPTARFMGGRDYELWMGDALGAPSDLDLVKPAAALGKTWRAAERSLRATRAALELADRTLDSLSLIEAQGPLLVEGRFAGDRVFTSSLARGIAPAPLFVAEARDAVSLGALGLVLPGLARRPLLRIDPQSDARSWPT